MKGNFHNFCRMKKFILEGDGQSLTYHIPQRYKVLEHIAAEDRFYCNKVAVKCCRGVLEGRRANAKLFIERMYKEIEILLFLTKHGHENTLGLLDLYHQGNDVYLIFDLYGTNLRDFMRCATVSKSGKKKIIYDTLRGIHYLHSCGILHRDLKPKNILAQPGKMKRRDKVDIKLIDFGLSAMEDPEEESDDLLVSRWYRSLELLLETRQTSVKSIDMWSFGCIMAEILTGTPLIRGRNEYDQIQKIVDLLGLPKEEDTFGCECGVDFMKSFSPKFFNQLNKKLSKLDYLAVDLIRQCLKFNVDKRITAEKALNHPYFEGVFNKNDFKTFGKKAKYVSNFDRTWTTQELRRKTFEMIQRNSKLTFC